MKFSALLLCLAASPLFSQDFFPLHVGNQWIYQTSAFGRLSHTVVDIPRTEAIGDQTYSVIRGFEDGPALLRMSDNGTLYRYNRESKAEEIWAVFATKEGDTYRTTINPCNQTARVESRSAKTTVPAGEFVNALSIRYPAANCADAGLDGEVYAPYIGLVERTSVTIAGPRRLQLIYARVGGVTVLSAPEVSFTVALNQPAYKVSESAIARLTLRNASATPLELTFPSSQRFDILIRNEAGAEVYRWSATRSFATVLGREEIAGGEINYVESIPLSNTGVQPLAAGRYTLEAWIAGSQRPRYAATVGFDIR
jgi:hypothetical protein